MDIQYTRAIYERAANVGNPGDVMRFIAATEHPGRDGMIIKADGWELDNFRANPVVLWAHAYGGGFGGAPPMPIGKATVEVDGKRLIADITFDQGDEFARQIERKYREGFLSAVSVGWRTLEVEPSQNPQIHSVVTKSELLDISAVPVPGDPKALKMRQLDALKSLAGDIAALIDDEQPPATEQGQPPIVEKHRGAIAPHSTDKAPIDADWDGPGEMAKAEGAEQLRRMAAWVDDTADPETKRAYKLPHHQASGEVVWRGVAAAMSRLLQAATQIPDEDRRGVYNHLVRHYRQFDKEPPEFRTAAEIAVLGPVEVRGLFFEEEPELFPYLFETRAGAAISMRNRGDLEQAVSLIQGVLARASKAEPEKTDEEREAETAAAILAALSNY